MSLLLLECYLITRVPVNFSHITFLENFTFVIIYGHTCHHVCVQQPLLWLIIQVYIILNFIYHGVFPASIVLFVWDSNCSDVIDLPLFVMIPFSLSLSLSLSPLSTYIILQNGIVIPI